MPDVTTLTNELFYELSEYLKDAPIDLSGSIDEPELYDKCYEEVISRLADEAEARTEEAKYKEYDERNN